MGFARAISSDVVAVFLTVGLAFTGFVSAPSQVHAASTEEIRQAISGKGGTWHYRQRSGSIEYTDTGFTGSGGLKGTWSAKNDKYCFHREHPKPESSCVKVRIRKNGEIKLGNGVTLKLE